MSYKPIPGDDCEDTARQSNHVKDLENSQQNALRMKGSRIIFDRIFQVLTLVLLSLLLVLAVLDIAVLRKQLERQAENWSIHREYGSDHHYMSIDQSYDYLWSEEMDARKALIYLSPQQEATERPEVGSISM